MHLFYQSPLMESTIVKTYPGRELAATQAFQRDAAAMAAKGYHPTSQQYVPGSYGCGSFIVAALLCFVLIGIIVFIYMLIVKPAGVLTVTYEYRVPDVQQTAPPLPAAALPQRYFIYAGDAVAGPYERAALMAMRSIGQITDATPCCTEGADEWRSIGEVL